MTAKLTPNLRLRNAQDFLENLVNHPITPPNTSADGSHKVDRNHYIFIGRTKPWPNIAKTSTTETVSELSPPTPKATRAEELEARDHMIALKKVRDVDATLVVRRFNWDATGNTIYAPYDVDDADLFNHPTQAEIAAANASQTGANPYTAGSHYVVVDYNIFKCLNNGNGAKSTIKPTRPAQPTQTVYLDDGYVWKYMGRVTNYQTQYFLTNQWLPVKTLTADDGSDQWLIQEDAKNVGVGALASFLIKNAGTNYVHVLSDSFISATSNTAQLPTNASGVDGAYVGCHVWLTSGAGAPAGPFVVSSYSGASKTLTIEGQWLAGTGTGFEILPQAKITGNGTGAQAKVLVDSTTNKIKHILPVNVGQGYTQAKIEIIGGRSDGGTQAQAAAQLSPSDGHGGDIEKELNGCYVMLTGRLPYDDGSQDFPLSNDYRQIGIIRDVRAFAAPGLSASLANQATLRASSGIRLESIQTGAGGETGGGEFKPDEIITGNLNGVIARARVIAFISGTQSGQGTIHYWQDEETGYAPFVEGMTITGSVTQSQGSVATGGIVNPEIQKYSGDILYIDNRRPILRAPNQTEILRAVIKF